MFLRDLGGLGCLVAAPLRCGHQFPHARRPGKPDHRWAFDGRHANPGRALGLPRSICPHRIVRRCDPPPCAWPDNPAGPAPSNLNIISNSLMADPAVFTKRVKVFFWRWFGGVSRRSNETPGTALHCRDHRKRPLHIPRHGAQMAEMAEEAVPLRQPPVQVVASSMAVLSERAHGWSGGSRC